MNLALGIGTLLLGGWVMPDSGQPQPDMPAPRIERPAPDGRPAVPRTRPTPGSDYSGARQGDDVEPMVPLAPTDPTLQSPDSPWATPTQTKPGAQSKGFGTRPYSGGNQGMSSMRPTQRTQSTRSSRSYGSTAGRPVFRPNIDLVGMQQAPTPRVETGPKPQAAGTQLSKPFANYTAPSGISPYQSLYNYNPTGGVSDNYNMFVRPQIEQQRANRVVGGEIRGLQSTSRLQSSALQRLGKKAENLGGTMAPEYYMNIGNYFPGLAH